MIPTSKPVRETSPFYPTLSTRGWVTGMNEKVDRIFTDYFTSQYNQTVYHVGFVRSLQKTVKENYSIPTRLCQQIKEDLEYLLSEYLDYVDVNVTYQEREDSSKYDIFIDATIIHAGYKWKSFKGVMINESKFEEIVQLNNNGGVSLV